MKKMLAMASAVFVALVSFTCRPSGKYADYSEYMSDVIEANEDYISALEKANSPKEVAEAITELGDKMETITKVRENIEKKYPEIKTIDRKNPPSELKKDFDRLDEMTQKLLTVYMKKMKYMMDPEVMKASQEMAKKSGNSGLFD
ncbi:MAG: hypothetical protein JW807_07600 [Spirochaetes bacterium]|nr:hypothetical protein [Spirochaetota bacterium]